MNNRNYEIYDGCFIGKNVFFGHWALIRKNTTIKDNVSIGSYTEISHHCFIGEGTRIHSKCFICEDSIISENVWIGPGVIFCNDKYPNTNNDNKAAPFIGKNAIIGAGSIIYPGVKIADNSIIGCCSLLMSDTEENEVWVGNPAQFIKYRNEINEYSIM